MPSYPIGVAYGKVIIDATNLARAQATFLSFGRTLMTTGALGVAAVAGVVKVTADFERELDFFRAVSGATEAQMERVRAKALELGTGGAYGPRELAAAFAELGKAGVRVDDILGGVADAVVSLGAAGDIPLAQAAEYLVNVMQTFQLEASRATHVADLFAGAANASTVDVEDLAFSFKYAGSVAQSVGVNVDDLTTAIGMLGLAGIRGSTAGTSLRRILLNLTPVSEEATEAMKELGIITEEGWNQFYDWNGQARPMAEILGVLKTATQDLSAEQRTQALNTIFGNRAVASAAFLAQRGAEGFRAFRREILGISAATVAEERLDNLSGSLRILKNTLEATFIQAGTGAQEGLQDMVESITRLVQKFGELSPETQANIVKFVGLTSVVLIAAGAVSWAIGSFIRLFVALKGIGMAIKTVWPILLMLAKFLGGALVAAVGTVPAIIIGVVIAIVGALTFLYFKVEAVRNFIDGAWQWLQRAWDSVLNFFKSSGSKIASIWGKITDFFGKAASFIGEIPSKLRSAWESVVSFFKSLPGRIIGALQGVASAVMGFVGRLPSMIVGFLQAAGSALLSFLSSLPSRIAYMLGYALGTVLRWSVNLAMTMRSAGQRALSAISNFIGQIPSRVMNFLNMVVTFAMGWGARFLNTMRNTANRIVTSVMGFISTLPGRIAGFLNSARATAVNIFNNLRARAADIVQNLVQRVGTFFSNLPGRIIGFIQTLPSRIAGIFRDAKELATDAISGMIEDILGLLRDLPSRAVNALSGFASAIGDTIRNAASSAWDGFTSAFTGSPQTLIEHVLVDMVKATHKVGRDMERELSWMNRYAFQKYGPQISSALYGPRISPSAGIVRAPVSAIRNRGNGGGGDTFNLTTHTDADAAQIMAEYSWMKTVVVTRRG